MNNVAQSVRSSFRRSGDTSGENTTVPVICGKTVEYAFTFRRRREHYALSCSTVGDVDIVHIY